MKKGHTHTGERVTERKKTAIVTGGARGIGLGIAQQLATDGYNIVILGTREEAVVGQQIEQLRTAGTEILYFQGNIARVEDCYACVEKTIEKFQAIDVLVNNAGIAPKVRADILETSEESLDRVFGVNVKGTFFMTQAVARRMQEQENGTIIQISSISAYASSVNRPEYCLSKSAISMITTLFADRLAASGIRVYEIRPGIIKTEMTEGVAEKYDQLIKDGVFPIARWGYPEDVAKAVSALAGGAFPYSTGDVINVDGGFHLRRI